MSYQNYRVTNGLDVGIGGTIITTTPSGNVGVATTNPLHKLQVNGSLLIASSGITSQHIPIVPSADNRGNLSFYGNLSGGIGTVPIFSLDNDISGNLIEITSPYGDVPTGYGVSEFAAASAGVGGSLGISFIPALSVSYTNNVGVGTTLPRQRFDVIGNAIISGNLGIGTTNPGTKLDIIGNTIISGSLGIGTTNPPTRLYVSSGSSSLYESSRRALQVEGSAVINQVGSSSTQYVNLVPTTLNGGSLSFQRGLDELQLFSISNNNDSAFSVTGIGSTNLSVDSFLEVSNTGNVGVGTSIPLQKLDVRGSVLVASGTSTGQHITLRPVGVGTRPSEPATESLSYERLYSGLSTTNTFSVPLLGLDGDYENVFSINSLAPIYSVINVKNDGKLGFGSTSPATRFDVNVDANFRSSVGIGTTIPRQTLDLIGTTLLSNVGSASNETYTLRPYNVGVNSSSPVRGALNYESDFDGSTKSGGKVIEISSDNTNLFTVNAFMSALQGFSTSTNPFFTALQVTQLGNVGIATELPIQRFQVGTRNDFVAILSNVSASVGVGSTAVSFSVGVTTNTILGINTTGITTGLIIQEISNLIAPGTTVVSIGTDRIGISTLTLNGTGITTATLTFGRRGDDNIVVINSTGSVGIGTTNPTSKLDVLGNANISGIVTVGLGSTSSPSVNSTMSFELTNDTTLTVRVRGSDGTTRVGIITLT